MNITLARIAIVDDELAVRTVIGKILEESGYEAASYPDGKAALHAIGSEAFDLVITDLRMPVMDGFELLKQLHALNPNLPVIVLSSESRLDAKVQATRQKATDLLPKPVSVRVLLAAVEKALGSEQ